MSPFDTNTLLNGRVLIKQPRQGFKASSDAVFLASSILAEPGDRLLDVGCGVGSAALCLLARIADIHVTGIEIDALSRQLAQENAVLNNFTHRFTPLCGDIFSPDACGENFDHVFSNPPYYHPQRHSRPLDHSRHRARVESTGSLEAWVNYCCRRTKSRGTLTFIFPTMRCHELIILLTDQDIGSLRLFPLWSKENVPAKRILIQGIKGSQGPFVLCPGLIVHGTDGTYTPAAEGILRKGRAIVW